MYNFPQKIYPSNESLIRNNNYFLEESKIELVCGDGRKGFKEKAPYDCIHVGAGAENIPQDLIDQLSNGGRMVEIYLVGYTSR